MTFAIHNFSTVQVRSVNIRSEMRGQDAVPAMDITFVWTTSNRVLDLFDPHLRQAMYCKARTEGAEPELESVDPISELPELRSPSLAMPIKLNREYLGRNIAIDYGLGGKSNIELGGADVNDFSADCKEGGSVDLKFRAQISGVDAAVLGKVGALVRHNVKITLLASEEASGEKQVKIPGADTKKPESFSAGAGTVKDAAKPAAKTATEVFTETHGKKPEVVSSAAWPFPGTESAADQAKGDNTPPPQSTTVEKPAKKVPAKKKPAAKK